MAKEKSVDRVVTTNLAIEERIREDGGDTKNISMFTDMMVGQYLCHMEGMQKIYQSIAEGTMLTNNEAKELLQGDLKRWEDISQGQLKPAQALEKLIKILDSKDQNNPLAEEVKEQVVSELAELRKEYIEQFAKDLVRTGGELDREVFIDERPGGMKITVKDISEYARSEAKGGEFKALQKFANTLYKHGVSNDQIASIIYGWSQGGFVGTPAFMLMSLNMQGEKGYVEGNGAVRLSIRINKDGVMSISAHNGTFVTQDKETEVGKASVKTQVKVGEIRETEEKIDLGQLPYPTVLEKPDVTIEYTALHEEGRLKIPTDFPNQASPEPTMLQRFTASVAMLFAKVASAISAIIAPVLNLFTKAKEQREPEEKVFSAQETEKAQAKARENELQMTTPEKGVAQEVAAPEVSATKEKRVEGFVQDVDHIDPPSKRQSFVERMNNKGNAPGRQP